MAVAPRVAAVYVKRAEQTHRCSLTGTTTFLFQVTSSKWTRACTPGLTYTFESFVAVRAREDIAGMLEQAAQGPPKVQPPPMQPRAAELSGGVRLTVSPRRQPAQVGLSATSSARSVAASAAPPSSPARSSPGRVRSATMQMNAGQHKALQKDFAPQMNSLRVRLRSMSYGSGRYSAQDPAGLFKQFDRTTAGSSTSKSSPPLSARAAHCRGRMFLIQSYGNSFGRLIPIVMGLLESTNSRRLFGAAPVAVPPTSRSWLVRQRRRLLRTLRRLWRGVSRMRRSG